MLSMFDSVLKKIKINYNYNLDVILSSIILVVIS